MGGEPDLSRLEDAVQRAGESLAAAGASKSAKQETLRGIFRMNHEIGRIAREFPSITPALREMQLDVNFVTIRVKRDEPEEARAGFERVVSQLKKVRDIRAAIPQD